MIESLEQRRLLSASIFVKSGTLFVQGTPRADQIIVSDRIAIGQTPATPSIFVVINGRTRQLSSAGIKRVHVETGAGDDSVTMSDISFGAHFGRPELYAQNLHATILGGSGDDYLGGGNANDFISGGPGRDFIAGGQGDDTLQGDGNSDTLGGNEGKDIMRGGAGDDRFIGNDDDQIFGGAGLDIVGADVLISRPGATFQSSSDVEATANILDHAIPNFEISRLGTLTIFGTRRSDVIQLDFFGENKPFFCTLDINGHSVDINAYLVKRIQLVAGDGDDTIVLQEDGQTVHINNGSTPIFIPVTLMGGNGNDSLVGGIGSDYLNGGAGDDFLAGSGGNDTLDGGDGTDTLRGDQGDDVLLNGESNLQGPEPADTPIFN
jgi:Ca2+-binding RTX toxin-like protein